MCRCWPAKSGAEIGYRKSHIWSKIGKGSYNAFPASREFRGIPFLPKRIFICSGEDSLHINFKTQSNNFQRFERNCSIYLKPGFWNLVNCSVESGHFWFALSSYPSLTRVSVKSFIQKSFSLLLWINFLWHKIFQFTSFSKWEYLSLPLLLFINFLNISSRFWSVQRVGATSLSFPLWRPLTMSCLFYEFFPPLFVTQCAGFVFLWWENIFPHAVLKNCCLIF